jgi:hypothetical protein
MSYIGVPPFGQTVRTVTERIATQDQTVFYPDGGYIPGYIDVEYNGSGLGSQDFTALDGLSVTLTKKAEAGGLFRSKAYWPVSLIDTMRRAEINGIVGAGGWAMRNRVINGDMRIDQRNAGALVSGTTGNIYGVDRFATGVFGSGTGRISAQQSSTVPTGAGFTKSIVNTVTTADAAPSAIYGYCFQQKVEGYNAADLMWGTANAQTVTLTFWVRSSLTGTYIVTFSNGDVNRTYSATYTINSANTWEQKTITVAGDTTGTWDSTNGNGIHLIWGLGGGSSRQAPSTNAWNTGAGGGVYAVTDASGCVDWIATNGATFYITGVQLEKGSYATPFDFRPIGTELALCQRYYCKSFDMALQPSTVNVKFNCSFVNGNTFADGYTRASFAFPVTMRAAPTVTTYSGSTTGQVRYFRNTGATVDGAQGGISPLNETTFVVSGNYAGSGSNSDIRSIFFDYTASAEL